jgi:crotonobetaine/carnitine-CoA ligase
MERNAMSAILPLAPLEERTVPALLDRARGFGLDRPFFIDLESGDVLRYGAFLERVSGTAHALAARLPAGATVATLVSNRPEAMIFRFALTCAGLCEAAINGEHKGPVLAEMLRSSGAAAVVVENRFRENYQASGVAIPAVIGEEELVSLCRLTRPWEERPRRPVTVGEASRIIYTSGSSGVSKGAELSHGYEVYTGYAYATRMMLDARDRWFYVTPFFHIDAILAVSATLHAGGAFILGPRFSASRFWPDVLRTEASVILYVGTILAILMKQGDPPAGHKVRVATGVGGTPASRAFFEDRHGIPLLEIYGLSECAACALDDLAARRKGSCGKPLSGYDVVVADPEDRPLPPGKRGQILIRPREPFALFSNYRGNPAGSVKAFANLWFHTGDVGSFDADGHIYFHGRVKDVIRTRDENVSAEELEAIAEAHPQVMMAAAVGVPGELGDEDILLYARPRAGETLDPVRLCAYMAERCAPFMVPRHVKIVDSFPMTPTEKIAKAQLARTLDAATWSRPGPRRA